MKIIMLETVLAKDIGTMVDLQVGDIIALDDSVAQKLIDDGKADYKI